VGDLERQIVSRTLVPSTVSEGSLSLELFAVPLDSTNEQVKRLHIKDVPSRRVSRGQKVYGVRFFGGGRMRTFRWSLVIWRQDSKSRCTALVRHGQREGFFVLGTVHHWCSGSLLPFFVRRKLNVGACWERVGRKEFDQGEDIFIKVTLFPSQIMLQSSPKGRVRFGWAVVVRKEAHPNASSRLSTVFFSTKVRALYSCRFLAGASCIPPVGTS
jgi:hypothetical protein